MMVDTDPHAFLHAFCAGRVTPEDFEATLYADGSPLERLLNSHSMYSHTLRKQTTPYSLLLDIDIRLKPEHTKSIVRQYLSETNTRQAVDGNLVSQCERRLAVKLPASFVDFVSKTDLSQFGTRVIEIRGSVSPDLTYYLGSGKWVVDEIWGISEDEDDNKGILQTRKLCEAWELPAGLVLLNGDGHFFIALDYRESADAPTVIFIDSDTQTSHILARDFAEFLRRLKPDDADET